MRLNSFTGSSIQAALATARRRLGDDVLLIESTAASGDEPARITVILDKIQPNESPVASETARATATRPVLEPAFAEETAQGGIENVSAFAVGRNAYTCQENAPVATIAPPKDMAPPAPQRTNRGRLYPRVPSDTQDDASQKQLRQVHERLEQMERRLSQTVIGASHQWAAHSLFGFLLERGMPHATIGRLFNGLIERGHSPETPEDELRWAAAQELRRMLSVATPKIGAGTLLVLGPSGSGKTSSLLKIARHPSFYGRRSTVVLSIVPEAEHQSVYLDPTALFRRHELPVLSVETDEDMAQALKRTAHFDQVLIDTPPLPAGASEQRAFMRRISRLTRNVMPMQVLLSLNATRALDSFEWGGLQRHALKPEAITLTHLDETRAWGRIAEWLLNLEMPVPFVSAGAGVPDGVTPFSTAWFVEQLMDLQEKM